MGNVGQECGASHVDSCHIQGMARPCKGLCHGSLGMGNNTNVLGAQEYWLDACASCCGLRHINALERADMHGRADLQHGGLDIAHGLTPLEGVFDWLHSSS